MNKLSMKLQPSLPPHRSRQAFTLVELLVAMGVIAVLVGITFGAVSGAWNSSNKAAAISQIQAISTAVESYQIDNGIYPAATALATDEEPSGDPSGYTAAGSILFEAVTGSPTWGSAPNTTNYFPNLKKNMVQQSGSADYFIDPWGFAFGYRSLDYGDLGTDTNGDPIGLKGYNLGFFDLWSTGGSSDDDSPKWIVNWQDPNLDRQNAR